MDIKITPSSLSGRLSAIPSKSYAHRLLISASLSKREALIKLSSTSEDIEATVAAVCDMGREVKREGKSVRILSGGFKKECTINAKESGSTLRFLLPVASAVCEKATFNGEGRLPKRPIKELITALSENGISFDKDTLPFTKTGILHAGRFVLPGNVSSQYVSGLMFALPLLEDDSEIILTSPLESSGYVDITRSVLDKFGIKIEDTKEGYFIKGGQEYIAPSELSVEGDWSNAAFFLVGGSIGKGVSVSGLDLNSAQGDKSILEVLSLFGAKIEKANCINIVPSNLKGIKLDISDIPDLFPALAVLSSFAKGSTVFEGCARLRLKESDRLKTVTDMINALGGKAVICENTAIIEGNGLQGGVVDASGDHRIVMAAAIAGSFCKNEVIIRGAEAKDKSYPAFFEDFEKIGGIWRVI